jgi:outer membrane protein assembly factor BamB
MKKKLTLFVIVVCSILITKCTYGSNGYHSDNNNPTETETVPAVTWSYTLTDGRIGSTIIDDKSAYFDAWTEDGRQQTRIEAYDLEARQIRWAISETTDTYILLGDGKLFLLDRDQGILSAISAKDGEMVWNTSVPAQAYEYEMTFGGGLLFLGVQDVIYAVDTAAGHTLWKHSLPSNFKINQAWLGNTNVYRDYDALSYYDGLLYARLQGSTHDEITEALFLAMDAADGHEKWRLPFDVPATVESPLPMVASQPVFEGEFLFFGDWTGRIYLLNKDTGEVIWEDLAEFPVVRPLLKGERVYMATSRNLLSFDTETGC